MSATLLWSTGGVGTRATRVSFTTPSPVPAPGYISFAIRSASDLFIVSSASSSLPYKTFTTPSGTTDYAATVIWKVQSGSFSGTLTVNFSRRLNDCAFTAWAVTGAKLVYYYPTLNKRCVLEGGNLFFMWAGYYGSPNQISCPDLTVVRGDSGGADRAQSYLYTLASDRYPTFNVYDWCYSRNYYSCNLASFNRFEYWFLATNVFAPDPRLPTTEFELIDAHPSIAPMNRLFFYDLTNITFTTAQPQALVSPYGVVPHDLGYAIHARGASVRPNDRPGRSTGLPVPLGDTWPMLTISPGSPRIVSRDDAILSLAPGLGSVFTPPTATIGVATPTASLDAPSSTYEVDPIALFMEPQFGYRVPGAYVGVANAFAFGVNGAELHFAAKGTGLSPIATPGLSSGVDIFTVVPMYRASTGRPGIAPPRRGEIGLAIEPPAVQTSTPPASYRLGVGRASAFVESSGGGVPSLPVAPCIIRLTWDSRSICLKDYKVFEVNIEESGHVIRIGLELAKNKDGEVYKLLLLLKPGQLVDLDTMIAGGFIGTYRVRDISSVSLAKAITFDILLQEEG